MKSHTSFSANRLPIISAFFALLLLVAGCVISPRRIVVEGPSPTPTPSPGITPTPTPGATPTPSPTPSPAAAPVPQAGLAQFLFVGNAGSPLITAFRINHDGSLMPVPGSPFLITAPVRNLVSMNSVLVAAGANAITAYKVDRETGAIQQTDSVTGISISRVFPSRSTKILEVATQFGTLAYRVSEGKFQSLPAAAAETAPEVSDHAVLDSTAKFMYVADAAHDALLVYRVDSGRLVPLALSYPLPRQSSGLALVVP